jgi:hypothetical protein
MSKYQALPLHPSTGISGIHGGQRVNMSADKIAVENVNVPGETTNVDAAKYRAMRKAFLKILPSGSPGLTQREILARVKAHLPASLFPGGATSGWWAKTVQLNLEAAGVVKRAARKPLRWHRA